MVLFLNNYKCRLLKAMLNRIRVVLSLNLTFITILTKFHDIMFLCKPKFLLKKFANAFFFGEV